MAVRFSASGQGYTRTLSLGTQTKLSATCWVKMSSSRGVQVFTWSLTGSGQDSIALGTPPELPSMMTVIENNVGSVPAGPTMTVGTWYFLGMSYNAGSVTLTYRALSASTFSTSTSSAGQANHGFTTLSICPSGEWLDGCVAGLKAWVGTAMTTAQLQQEAWTYLPRYPNPTFWYPLLKTETADYSGNGYALSGGSGATTEDGPGVGWGWIRLELYAPLVTAVTHDLASDGLASSSGTAAANVLYPLASAGLASSSGAAAANVLFSLAAAGVAASSGSAASGLLQPMVSTGLAAGTGAGILNTLGSMVADGLASSSGAAAALVGVVLASDGVATPSGLAEAQVISGLVSDGLAVSTGVGSLITAVPLEAAGLAASTAAAEVNLDLSLISPATSASSGAAAVQVESGLAAAVEAASAGTAGLQAVEALAGSGEATEAAAAALTAMWTLEAAGQATSTGSAEAVVGFVFIGLASSSGSADLSLTITLGTAIALESSSADAVLSVDADFTAAGMGTATGRAVLYIALPYVPGPTHAPGRGQGGGTFGPDNRTRASGPDTGRTRG